MSELHNSMPEDAARTTCLRCGSRHLMHEAAVAAKEGGTTHDLIARIFRRRMKNFSFSVSSKITACICADCGHTELITDNLTELWDVYSEQHR